MIVSDEKTLPREEISVVAHSAVKVGESPGVEHLLDKFYGKPWNFSMSELQPEEKKSEDHTVTEPGQVFSLTEGEYVFHPLADIARSRLCRVDLEFGSEIVTGILDTGAQRSLLNTSSYERVKSLVPPLLTPLAGAQGFVGATGTRLTVHGELRRCPVTLNGYQYFVNLVVADLGTVSAILGMDFLMAYDADISLRRDTVSFRAGTVINSVREECGLDRVPVRVGQDCAMLAGHLNRCSVRAEGGTLRGTYLFEPTHTFSTQCQLEAQLVNVVNGTTDLYVEHRGAGPAIQLPRDLMLGELRQLGATKVTTTHHGTVSCHTIYQIFEKRWTSVRTDMRMGKAAIAVGEATRLCFTVVGEHDAHLYPYCGGVRSPRASVGPEKSSKGDILDSDTLSCENCKIAVVSESLLMPRVVGAGFTVVGHGGQPLHYWRICRTTRGVSC